MTRHRDFDVDPDAHVEPITFTLLGQPFTCIPEAPAAVLTDFVDSASPGGARAAGALVAFLEGVVVDHCSVCAAAEKEQQPRSRKALAKVDDEDVALGLVVEPHDCAPDVDRLVRLLHSKETTVPIKMLGDLVMWVAEEYTARPTQPSSGSSNGRGQTRATSTDGSPSRGSRASTG